MSENDLQFVVTGASGFVARNVRKFTFLNFNVVLGHFCLCDFFFILLIFCICKNRKNRMKKAKKRKEKIISFPHLGDYYIALKELGKVFGGFPAPPSQSYANPHQHQRGDYIDHHRPESGRPPGSRWCRAAAGSRSGSFR